MAQRLKKPHVPVPFRPDTLDRFARVQPGYRLGHAFPSILGFCACRCGTPIPAVAGRKWARGHSMPAFHLYGVVAGNSSSIRILVFKRDRGICAKCRVDADAKRLGEGRSWLESRPIGWEADHIVPVAEGGGACGLENFRTLCVDCHKARTAAWHRERAADRRRNPAQVEAL